MHLHPSDIDRSHRSGRVVGKRSILVKFANYNARHAVYSKRMDLCETDNWSNTFINEDLTARRSKILFTARRYVREKLLSSSYSTDGRIYVKDGDGKKHLIIKASDLEAFGTLPELRPGAGGTARGASAD